MARLQHELDSAQRQLSTAKLRIGVLESLASSTDEELLVKTAALKEKNNVLKAELFQTRTRVHSLVTEREAKHQSEESNKVEQQLADMTQKYTKLREELNELGRCFRIYNCHSLLFREPCRKVDV